LDLAETYLLSRYFFLQLGKLIFDLITNSFSAGLSIVTILIAVFSYGSFITLTVGFILRVIRVIASFFAFLLRKQV
jgi:hypothetical protein